MPDCKQEILSKIPNNNCCGHAFISTIFNVLGQFDKKTSTLLINTKQDIADKIIKIVHNFYPDIEIDCWESFLCFRGNVLAMLIDCNFSPKSTININLYSNECDLKVIVKVMFLIFGNFYYNVDNNVNSKGYNLEFVFRRQDLMLLTYDLLNQFGFGLTKTTRQNNYVLYSKNSSQICDLLVLLGAVNKSLEVQNSLVIRELRNNVNRQNNCFESNLDKTLTASAEQMEAISYLMDNDLIYTLDDNLKTVALARIANPDVSLKNLQTILDNKISRAGIKYRLDKIISIYHKHKGDN